MNESLKLASECSQSSDVPIGCVVVKDGQIIGKGRNRVEESRNSINHAEIEAINQALDFLGGKHLIDCDIYVTLEPCSMCAGAIVLARMRRVYFGAFDLKTGACGSVFNVVHSNKLNHKCDVYGGILEEECSDLLKIFFRKIRKEKYAKNS